MEVDTAASTSKMSGFHYTGMDIAGQDTRKAPYFSEAFGLYRTMLVEAMARETIELSIQPTDITINKQRK